MSTDAHDPERLGGERSDSDLDDLWSTAENGELRFSVHAIRTVVMRLRRKVTPVLDAEVSHGLLDSESTYDGTVDAEEIGTLTEGITFDKIAAAGDASARPLMLRIIKRAGRASTYRARSSYSFEPGLDGENDGSSARQRGRDANHRKATRAAADEALVNKCTVWVTLTFDDLHRVADPLKVIRRFLRVLRDRYRSHHGKPLKYVGVVGVGRDGRAHLHILLSHDVDVDEVLEVWPYGHVADIQVIDEADIEQKVRYMAKNVEASRVTFGRFIRSRTPGVEIEEIPIDGIDEGRAILEELISPRVARVERAQMFGGRPGVAYRFDPIRDDD